ncbi:MAG: YkgJ family cysteine cluster protein, partial [Cryomorphaceae bacterium]|nr:YkgJ family cysteine cluster protein [Cryomorphaceae bacterium]
MANYLERIWPDFKDLARSKRKENKKFFGRLSKQDSKKLNAEFHAVHEEVFA